MNKINKDNFKQDAYKYGLVTEIEDEKIPKGLNEEVIKLISSKKNEPNWMLEWRLAAYDRLKSMEVPCLLYTSPSPRDRTRSRMPSSA